MNDFHFLRPAFLWLLFIPVVCIIGRLLLRHRNNRMTGIEPEMRPYLINKYNGYKELLFGLLPLSGLAIGIIALSGPTWEHHYEIQPERSSIALVVNLPENCNSNEIRQMKVAVYQLLDSLRSERVSLSVQSGSSHQRLLRTYTEFIAPDIMPAAGDDMKDITKVTTPPETTSFHSIIYITPSMSVKKAEQWRNMDFSADYKTVLAVRMTDIYPSDEITCIGANNEGMKSMLAVLKRKTEEKIQREMLQDSAQWKDSGYLLCFPAALLLLPLFFRYKKTSVLVSAVFVLSSCTYTGRMWNEIQADYNLLHGDTLQAIQISDDAFRRGMLLAGQHDYVMAAREFAKDSTTEALYNRAIVTYKNGNFLEALDLLAKVESRKPEWTFVSEDRKIIEKLIGELANVRSEQEDRSSNDKFDSFEKDDNKKLTGNESELWADKLMDEDANDMNIRGSKIQKRSEVLFKQIENDPKEFIKRRLEYEYVHKE